MVSAWACSFWGFALGAKTYKIKFGHRGWNQPVKNFVTGKVEITSQNHGFAVDLNTLLHEHEHGHISIGSEGVEMTHINLNEDSLEGLENKKFSAFAVQYHPEASPGPHDASYFFKRFAAMMEK